jgi:hypothetical protein
MTYQDIVSRVLSEVSGEPEQKLSTIISAFRKANPGGKWDQTLSDEDAEKLLTEYRAMGPGILNWLLDAGFKGRA